MSNVPEDKLLGTRVSNMLNALGGEKVAALIEKVGKRPCGCAGRKEALNRWHLNMIAAIDELKGNEKPEDN